MDEPKGGGHPRAQAERSALAFVSTEAGFAQLTTLDRDGYPVTRTMTAFLSDDWSAALIQRRSHERLHQWQANPRSQVSWIGSPSPTASNERPHVFDLGLRPPRFVSVRGTAEFMSDDWTVACYQEHLAQQRRLGHTKAPVRTSEQVVTDLVGVLIRPVKVRLEGFGSGAESFTFTPQRKETRP
jgi:hypothetical protein